MVHKTMITPVTDRSFWVTPGLDQVADDDQQDEVKRLQGRQFPAAQRPGEPEHDHVDDDGTQHDVHG